MEFNKDSLNSEKIEQNKFSSQNIKEFDNKKALRIHLELLSFIQNEIRNPKNLTSSFSYSLKCKSSNKQNIINKKGSFNSSSNNTQKLEDTYFSEEDDNEEEIENSSDMSCEEEIII